MIRRTLPLVLALGVALAACSPSSRPDAAESSNEATRLQAAQALVKSASKGAADVERVFEGEGGMVGVVIASKADPSQQRAVVWMSPDGTVLFPGPALDSTGQDINPRVAREQIQGEGAGAKANDAAQGDAATTGEAPNTAGGDKAAILSKAVGAGSFVQGTAGPILTAIVDLNCSHCNTFFADAQPLIARGELRVRYVLAGFLTPTSGPKAAAVLGAADPVAALKKAEADFARQGQKGLAPAFEARLEAVVKANNALLTSTGEPATPYLLYCDQATGTVVGEAGAPEDVAALAKQLGDGPHPACAN